MTHKKLQTILVIVLITLPAWAVAQGPDFGGDGDQVYDVAEVPFDGGVNLLVAAGIGYGLIKALQKRRLT